MTKGSSTLFLLGVAGMGLAAAMAFDARRESAKLKKNKNTAEEHSEEHNAELVEERIGEPNNDSDGIEEPDTGPVASFIDASYSKDYQHTMSENETESEASQESLNRNEEESEDEQDNHQEESGSESEPNLSEEEEDEEGTPLNYRDLYLREKRREQQRAIKEMLVSGEGDNTYKGDGSSWSKRIYFFKEAYRRAREKTPIDPSIKRAVKLGKMSQTTTNE